MSLTKIVLFQIIQSNQETINLYAANDVYIRPMYVAYDGYIRPLIPYHD